LQSFHQLYTDYHKDVFHFLLKLSGYQHILAEELTQETFYQAITSFVKFKGQCQVKTWLYQIAKNVFYQYLRKKKHSERLFETLTVRHNESSALSPQEQLENKDMVKAVHDVLNTFDEKTKDIMLYRLYSDLPYLQIATLLKISESSAKVIFFRGKGALQKKLKEVYGYEI
jgi:RNA polymerase sigma-70 factor (ECF subfamily)